MADAQYRPAQEAIAAFEILDWTPLVQTDAAYLWTVKTAHFKQAVLKTLVHPDAIREDIIGAKYLKANRFNRVVQILGTVGVHILMQHLPGVSLGDQIRQGRSTRADKALGLLIKDLTTNAPKQVDIYPHLQSWFEDLFTYNAWPSLEHKEARLLRRTQATAKAALTSTDSTCILHGDLHHDNVLRTPIGLRAIDAKGVMGPSAFEYANAFRNPNGMPQNTDWHQMAIRRAKDWSRISGHTEKELLTWAIARAGLSIAWMKPEQSRSQGEFRTLSALIQARVTFE